MALKKRERVANQMSNNAVKKSGEPNNIVQSCVIAGEVISIKRNEEDLKDVSMMVKLAGSDKIIHITQFEKSPLASLPQQIFLGKDQVKNKLRGIGVGSKIWSDSSYIQSDKVEGNEHVKIKGVLALKPFASFNMNAEIAIVPYHSDKIYGSKQVFDKWEPCIMSGTTAKVCSILPDRGIKLENPSLAQVREAVLNTAREAMSVKGARSFTVHLVSEAGEHESLSVPIFKDYKEAMKLIKDSKPLSSDHYIQGTEDKIEALGKLFDESMEVKEGNTQETEMAGSNVFIFPRTLEKMTHMSATSHSFLLQHGLKDEFKKSEAQLSQYLKEFGYPMRHGVAIMDHSDSDRPELSHFIIDPNGSTRTLSESIGIIAKAALPDFDMDAYKIKFPSEPQSSSVTKNQNDTPNSNDDIPNFDDDIPGFDDVNEPVFGQ